MRAADGRFAGPGISAALHVVLLALLVVLWRPRFLLPEHTTRVTLLAPIITSSHGGNAPFRNDQRPSWRQRRSQRPKSRSGASMPTRSKPPRFRATALRARL